MPQSLWCRTAVSVVREPSGRRLVFSRANARQLDAFTLPPEAILIRRMHAFVAVVLGQLRAGANWGAIAAEYLHGEAPATPLGRAEGEFFAQRGRTAAGSLDSAG